MTTPIAARTAITIKTSGLLDIPVDWKVYDQGDVEAEARKETPMEVRQGDRFRCSVEGCNCEITVTSDPQMEATQSFVDCCGHEMEKVS